MNRGRSRWLLKLAVLPLIAIAFLLWNQEKSPNLLTVENQSGQPVALLKVSVAGQTSTFRDLAAKTEVTAPLTITSDDHFTVQGRLADGTLIRGLFTCKAGERANLILLPKGEIKFHQGGKS